MMPCCDLCYKKYLEEDGPKFGNNGLRLAAEKAVLLLKIELEKLRKEVEG
jgi:hypothetical protein